MTRQPLEPIRPSDRFVTALARYVEALDRRYPGGPDAMHEERLAIRADRANMPAMSDRRPLPAA